MSVEQVVTLPSGNNENLSVKQSINEVQTPSAPSTSVEQNAALAKTDVGKAWELEKQLHEQYAINNNAHTSSFISFVVALLALFGALGYVYAFTPPYKYLHHDIFSIDVFFLLSIVVSAILLFLACICSHLGCSQRRDNIVITRIREKCGFDTTYNNPSEKKRKNFLPDYYNIFYWLFVSAQFGILILTIMKMCANSEIICEFSICVGIVPIVLQIICIISSILLKYLYFYGKYFGFISNRNK
ncbi:MAG: hypothetical protein IK025_03445 [Bacteroidales bacterium]|nr:hypothetical protein [Bacteroidales bacterium]